jgi:hypothetical protein
VGSFSGVDIGHRHRKEVMPRWAWFLPGTGKIFNDPYLRQINSRKVLVGFEDKILSI